MTILTWNNLSPSSLVKYMEQKLSVASGLYLICSSAFLFLLIHSQEADREKDNRMATAIIALLGNTFAGL